MSRTSYADVLGAASSTARGTRRVADVVAALMPPSGPDITVGETALARTTPTTPPVTVSQAAVSLAPGLVGAGIGAVVWGKHRVLGALAGHAVAANAYPILRGNAQARKNAMYQLGIEGAGIGGALYWKKHPVLGWFAGSILGSLAASLLPGNPIGDAYEKLKASE